MTCVPIAGNNPPVANNTWWRRLTTLPINYFQMILMETMREPLEGNGTQWWYASTRNGKGRNHENIWRYADEERMYLGWLGRGGVGVQTVNNPHTAASRPTTKDFLCLSNPCPFSKKGSQKHQRKWTVCEIEIYLIWQGGNNNHLSPTTHRLALIPPTITPNGPVDKHLYLNNTVF